MALRGSVRMPQPYFHHHGNFKPLPTWHDGISELLCWKIITLHRNTCAVYDTAIKA